MTSAGDRMTYCPYHVDATNAATGETWSVNAPTAYAAVFELARQIGWDFEE